MYKDFIHIFVLSCKTATFLIEKRLHQKLSLIEALQLNLHLSICKLCKSYEHKTKIMDKTMRIIAKNKQHLSVFSQEELEEKKIKIKEQVINKKKKESQ